MFYGSHEFVMDEKGRVTIPSLFERHFKTEDMSTLVMTRGLNSCVFCYPLTSWGHYMDKMKRMDVPTHDRLKAMRIILAWASNCKIDKLRRVKIPPRLAEFAKLKRDIMIVGHQDRIEIWDRKIYDTYHNVEAIEDEGFNYDETAGHLFVDMMPGAEKEDNPAEE